MLNLSEAWREAYSKYLEESMEQFNSEVDGLFEELSSAHKNIQNGFELVREYFESYELAENEALLEAGDAETGIHDGSEKNKVLNNTNISDLYLKLLNQL